MFRRYLFGAVVALLGQSVAAQAAIMEVTYTGAIYNAVSVDGAGLFGAAGASLDGKAISVTFTYDTSLAPVQVGPQNNYISNAATAVEITINGVTQSIGSLSSSLALNYHSGNQSHVQHEAYHGTEYAQYITIGQTDNVNGSLPLSLTTPYDFTGPLGTGFFRFEGGTVALFTPTHVTSVEIAAAVPEPSTWAMMILGFAGVGFMAYRRRNQVAGLRVA